MRVVVGDPSGSVFYTLECVYLSGVTRRCKRSAQRGEASRRPAGEFTSPMTGSGGLLGAIAVFAVGCFGEEATPFPPGLEPIEESTARTPEGMAERLAFAVGEKDEYVWAHARGFIHAPIARVWEAMKDPEVVADRRQVDELSFELEIEPEYDHSFVVHNVVHAVQDVRFDVTWRQGVVEGEREDPRVVAIRFQKTDGSTAIYLMEASIVLRRVDDAITELSAAEHLDAFVRDIEQIQSQLGDIHASVVARVHGEPLPTYR
jgi:hypothetical protein